MNPQALAVAAGSWTGSFVSIAGGPETFTIEELLRLLASEVGTRVQLMDTPPPQLPNLLARPCILAWLLLDASQVSIQTHLSGISPS